MITRNNFITAFYSLRKIKGYVVIFAQLSATSFLCVWHSIRKPESFALKGN